MAIPARTQTLASTSRPMRRDSRLRLMTVTTLMAKGSPRATGEIVPRIGKTGQPGSGCRFVGQDDVGVGREVNDVIAGCNSLEEEWLGGPSVRGPRGYSH